MGSILEVGKVVVTLWLHEYWSRCRWLMKLYLVPAVAVLMLITSMGIFGFLSKAHSDQSLVGGDVQAKIAIYDEKIKTEKENIETARRALKQMDEGVDQILGRSTSETGADRAVALRRSQQKERGRLLAEISQSQKLIAELNEVRAPIAAEIRKVEAEVGPLKYIAKLIYGDNPDANLLEKAVTWVIIIIVAVFDPLAIMMLLAATESLKWERQRVFERLGLAPAKEPEAEPTPEPEPDRPVSQDPHPTGWMFSPTNDLTPEKSIFEQHPYLLEPFPHFKDLTPMVYKPEPKPEIYSGDPVDFQQPWPEEKKEELVEVMASIFTADNEIDPEDTPEVQAAIRRWKAENPEDTLKSQRNLLARGLIDELPWIKISRELPRQPHSGFGTEFPLEAVKGDVFVRVDKLPNTVHKFNGNTWIEVDKTLVDSYTYDTAYIDHLIEKIDQGQYDIDLLSDLEREQIAQRLHTKNT
jgi:hypothetical protein